MKKELHEIVPQKSDRYSREVRQKRVIKVNPWSGGQLKFTVMAINDLDLGEGLMVTFATDGEVLYFKITNEESENARPLRYYVAKSGTKVAYVSISSILRPLGLNIEQIAGRYLYTPEEDSDWYRTTIPVIKTPDVEEN